LATVVDLFSRRLLGYAMGARHDAELVVSALHMAATTRGGDVRGVIFHTDGGSEYASRKFRRACRRLGVFPVHGPGRIFESGEGAQKMNFRASSDSWSALRSNVRLSLLC
jgi:transposase InsO family protein